MTLQIANGFEAFYPLRNSPAPFAAPDDGRRITPADVDALLNNPAAWLYQTMQSNPFEMIEYPLQRETVGALLMEFLTAQAVLAFRVKAAAVKPVKAMYRVALVDYTPWRQTDPPVPLLCMLDLPAKSIAMHNSAIHLFLSRGDASALRGAMSLVLRGGAQSGMHPAEAFYYVAKMLSLVTGAYSQG